MTIRKAAQEDHPSIYHLVRTAFATARVSDGTEQDFVLELRRRDTYRPELELVAEENGQLIGLASYKVGQNDGPWRIWSDKGNLLYEMFYTAGKKSGVWRSWDEEGNLLSEENQ